jgi:hypothetical protein
MPRYGDIRIYIQDLLDHDYDGCTLQGCKSCKSVTGLFSIVHNSIFKEIPYPAVTISSKRHEEFLRSGNEGV